MEKELKEYLYIKEYRRNENGNLILINPEMALKYNSDMNKMMYDNIMNESDIQKIKLKILNDFQKIYEYDLINANYPDLIGTFESSKEKEELRKKCILVEDFYLYLGNIFCNYHTDLLKQTKKIPRYNLGRVKVDFEEIYLRAVDEYFCVLNGNEYPKQLFKYIFERENIDTYINIESGKEEKIIGEKIDQDIILPKIGEYVYSTAYMLPALIERILIITIRIKLFYRCMDELSEIVKYKCIELTDEENVLFKIFSTRGDKIISTSKEKILQNWYNIFIKYHIVSKTNNDYKLILTEKSVNNKNITLGALLHSDYVKNVVRPEYYNLLDILFNTKKLNIRNSIMHGGDSYYNFFNIGFSSVMLQLFWDIADNKIFII